jgi:hypothetical protein
MPFQLLYSFSTYFSEVHAAHAVFHKTKDMFHPCPCFRFYLIVLLLIIG